MKTINSTLKIILTVILSTAALSGFVIASTSDFNKANLHRGLTPLGGEVMGNGAGTIPQWEGGITDPPSGYKVGDYHQDPYGEDSKLFTIDASNIDQYRDQLSIGYQHMVENYPTFKMHVYPTRRSASSPEYVYEATQSLVNKAILEDDGNGVGNAVIGIPFPIPTTGVEVIWNHILRYRGQSLVTTWGIAVVASDGSFSLIEDKAKVLFRYSLPKMTTQLLDNTMILFKYTTVAVGSEYDGEKVLVHETLNQKLEPRRAWTYKPTEGVKRAPSLAYDYLSSKKLQGLRTADQLDMYNGAPDRYTWKLIGKREMYVPYNSYRLHSDKLTYSDILKPKHLNPDHLRYELHRVWVVEANLKEGASHIYKRRVFYIDEDSWSILFADIYDSEGKLWRIQESHVINYYEASVVLPTLEVFSDLKSESYLAHGLNNESTIDVFNSPLSSSDFTPAALRKDAP